MCNGKTTVMIAYELTRNYEVDLSRYTVIDPYKDLPEWEKRRRQSRDAKADLIKRMKK